MSTDRIERKIEINAPISKVWKALTDSQQFGEWFNVKIEGPFVAGQLSSGKMTYPGFEHYDWKITVQKIEPETYFSFTWHPYAIDLNKDYSKETPTLIEFKLVQSEKGTTITVIESGFDKIPEYRRAEAIRMNEGGWTAQMNNIKKYVSQ